MNYCDNCRCAIGPDEVLCRTCHQRYNEDAMSDMSRAMLVVCVICVVTASFLVWGC